jgi:hypothetical protein
VVQAQLPEALIGWIKSMGMSPLGLMITLIITYIILGCFLEGIGLILITVPVFLPVVVASGYDPIWFGVLVVVVVELGLIHPPVGMNLFVIQAQVPDIPDSLHLQGHASVSRIADSSDLAAPVGAGSRPVPAAPAVWQLAYTPQIKDGLHGPPLVDFRCLKSHCCNRRDRAREFR